MPVLKGRRLNGRAWLVTVGAPVVVTPPIGGDPLAGLTSSTAFDRYRIFNRDVYTGNPPGFSTTYNKGWGAVSVTLTPSVPVTALFMRLHNALDAGAQQNVVGSGAVLQPPVAVQGATSLRAGANAVTLTVPAAKAWFYADLALDAAMTHPIRIPIPFGVGSVFGIGPGTSHGSGMVTPWAYDQGVAVPPISQMVNISPFGTIWSQGSSYIGASGGRVIPGEWQAPGDPGVSPYETTWAAEFLRLAIQQLGVNCGIVGRVEQGGNDYSWIAPYDTRADHAYGGIVDAMTHCGNKWEVQMALSGANDDGAHMTRGNASWLQRNVFDGLAAINLNPAMGTINGASPLFDTGDATDSWYRFHQAIRDLELSRAKTVNNDWYDAGGAWGVGGHTSMLSRLRISRQYYRLAMGLMGAAKGGFALRRGPRVVSATRSGTTITLTVQHDGGTALKKVAWSEDNGSPALSYLDIDTSAKPDSDLGYLFTVYKAGSGFYSDTAGRGAQVDKVALAATSVQVVNATTVRLFLASDPGVGVALDVFHAMDFGTPASLSASPRYVTILTDDTTDGDGLNYGRPLCRTLEPVYVAAPTPASQAITLNQPVNPVSGGWCCLTWSGAGATLNNAGTGIFASSIEFSVNGGAYAQGDGLAVNNANKGSVLVPIPASIAPGTSITIAARRVGQGSPDSTVTVTVLSARTELPDPDGSGALRASAVAIYDVMNKGTLWQDTAKTVRSSHLQPMRVWADALGDTTNDLVIATAEAVGCPFLDLRKRPFFPPNLTSERPYIMFGPNVGADGHPPVMKANNSNAARALAGSFTLFFVVDSYGSNWFSLGNPVSSASNYIEIDGLNKLPQPALQRAIGNVPGIGLTGTYIGGQFMDYLSVRYDNSTGIAVLRNIKGTVTKTGTPTLLTNSNAIWLGGAFPGFFGNLRAHQIVLFNRSLSDAEITSLETQAAAKWPLQQPVS